MSFLQPMLLAALPLVALPIIIHLINQRRYQTVRWAAMMFLLAANRMSRGYARLRQWLIMAVADAGDRRPDLRRQPAAGRRLARAWPAAAGPTRRSSCSTARPACSRAARGRRARSSRPGRRQLVRTLETLGSARWVADRERHEQAARAGIDRRPARARPAPSPSAPRPTSPAMLQAARDYIKANKPGRTEIWICSDLRENDWNADERPLADPPRRVPRVPAGRPVPPARLSPDRARRTCRSA